MEAHRETPPEGLWEAVEQGMDRQAKALSRRRSTLWWGIGSGAAAAVAALFFLLMGDGGSAGDPAGGGAVTPPVAVDHRPLMADPVVDTVTDPERVSGQYVDPAAVPTPVSMWPAPVVLPGGGEDTPVTIPGMIPDVAPEIIPETPSGATPETKPEPEEPRRERPTEPRPATPDYEKYLATDTPAPSRKSRRNGRWTAGLYASNSSFAGSRSNLKFNSLPTSSPPLFSDFNYGDASSYVSSSTTTPLPPPKFYYSADALRKSVYNDVKHRQPVTVGLSVGYGLGERWSLTGGVTYTRLASTFKTASGLYSGSCEQVLHYIGIPLDIKYDLWRSVWGLSVYLSAGGHAAKSVSGRVTGNGVPRLVTGGTAASGKISDPRVQWSVRGSAGVGYDFIPMVGLYVEPGVDYHFDNGSYVETVWKDRPLNFGFRLGFRLSL